MKESHVVSDRGQVTLPAAMRKSLGIGKSSVVTAEEVDGRIVLETERYTDEQIPEWNRADAFGKGERAKLTGRLKRRRAQALS